MNTNFLRKTLRLSFSICWRLNLLHRMNFRHYWIYKACQTAVKFIAAAVVGSTMIVAAEGNIIGTFNEKRG